MDCEQTSEDSSDIIQPINRETVHRICSGQVVLSLAVAVKELVENSIDAGATIINICLKEYGSDLIEVSDNGKGVASENFEALTLKHYTSKIRRFDDLESISTLGFRGEALSSLCALSDLSITTKHSNADHATIISYDRNGKILEQSLYARERGTTVTLENLFSTLPVRRKEFLKNLKREFNKMCQFLYAYCLVSKGVKFTCTNTTKKGSKNVVVSTDGLKTVRENIINVFGAKQISSLLEIDMIKPEEAFFIEFGAKYVEGEDLPFTFEFFISSVMHGSGRSATDRQFYYINSRPCEPAKIMKLVNQTYKQYNSSQYPFVYLNIISKSCLVDVNVTPDKRQVFLEKEKVLLATLKGSLIECFKNFPSTFKLQNLDLTQKSSVENFVKNNTASGSRGIKRSITDTGSKRRSILEMFQKRSKTDSDKADVKSPSWTNDSQNYDSSFEMVDNSDEKLNTFIEMASELCMNSDNDTAIEKNNPKALEVIAKDDANEIKIDRPKDSRQCIKDPIEKVNEEDKSQISIDNPNSPKEDIIESSQSIEEIKIVCPKKDKRDSVIDIPKNVNPTLILNSSKGPHSDNVDSLMVEENKEKDNENKNGIAEIVKLIINKEKSRNKLKLELPDVFELSLDQGTPKPPARKTVTLNVSIEDIRESLKKRISKNDELEGELKVRFRSEITPENNKSAEEELQKQISKADFAQMKVIGQFNLGFIIARLRNDLFIIDQHATDEKYNFEQLQANMVLGNQVLVNPKRLELTAGNESLLIENEEVFKKSGFAFKIDHSAPCTKKVYLTAVPLSKNFVFGKDDIDEMLFMLQDSNDAFCRPSRVRAMFASRACKKSVKIGNALSKSDMKKLIEHMGEIEQPWNCPHGRPTMRHLLNLDLLEKDKE